MSSRFLAKSLAMTRSSKHGLSAFSGEKPRPMISEELENAVVRQETIRQSFEDAYPLLPSSEVIEADIQLAEQTARMEGLTMEDERKASMDVLAENNLDPAISNDNVGKSETTIENGTNAVQSTARTGFAGMMAKMTATAARRNDLRVPDDIESAGPKARNSYLIGLLSGRSMTKAIDADFDLRRYTFRVEAGQSVNVIVEKAAETIFYMASVVNQAELRFKIFGVVEPSASDTTSLGFYLRDARLANGQLAALHDMEDLHYALCGKIRELKSNIDCRIDNGFIHPDAQLITHNGAVPPSSVASASSLRNHLAGYYEALTNSPLKEVLASTVKEEKGTLLEDSTDLPVSCMWAWLAEKQYAKQHQERQREVKPAPEVVRPVETTACAIITATSSVRGLEEILAHRREAYQCLDYNSESAASGAPASSRTTSAQESVVMLNQSVEVPEQDHVERVSSTGPSLHEGTVEEAIPTEDAMDEEGDVDEAPLQSPRVSCRTSSRTSTHNAGPSMAYSALEASTVEGLGIRNVQARVSQATASASVHSAQDQSMSPVPELESDHETDHIPKHYRSIDSIGHFPSTPGPHIIPISDYEWASMRDSRDMAILNEVFTFGRRMNELRHVKIPPLAKFISPALLPGGSPLMVYSDMSWATNSLMELPPASREVQDRIFAWFLEQVAEPMHLAIANDDTRLTRDVYASLLDAVELSEQQRIQQQEQEQQQLKPVESTDSSHSRRKALAYSIARSRQSLRYRRSKLGKRVMMAFTKRL